MDQASSMVCGVPQHTSYGSSHPKNHVPNELFWKDGVLLKSCYDCRLYKAGVTRKHTTKKRQEILDKNDANLCRKCGDTKEAGVCTSCVGTSIENSKQVDANYYKVILERVLEMGACCNMCRKVFLKRPEGVAGFTTVDRLTGVKTEDLELRNLEFDHLSKQEQLKLFGVFHGKKVRGVAQMGSYNAQKREAKKCQLLCISCHRLKTQERFAHMDDVKDAALTKHEAKVMMVADAKKKIGCCEDCKCLVDPNNLTYYEFDHIDPTTKFKKIAELVNRSYAAYTLEVIEAELPNCRLLCVFCHRIRSRQQSFERQKANRQKKRKLVE